MDKDQARFEKVCGELKVPTDCPGISWRKGSSDGDFDQPILPLLYKFNALDHCHTTGSCAGHTLTEIKNGKGLVKSPYVINLTLHVAIEHLDEFKEILVHMYDVSSNRFWCELGYLDDLNFRTETVYIPLSIKVFCNSKRVRDSLLRKYESILDEFLWRGSPSAQIFPIKGLAVLWHGKNNR